MRFDAAPVAPPIERELELAANPAELTTARAFVSAAAADYGFGETETFDFTFAANEAVTNAIEHGLPSADGTIRIRIVEEDGALALYVWDWGTFAPDVRPAGPLAEGGRGLPFIATLMDDVELSTVDGTTRIRFSKRL